VGAAGENGRKELKRSTQRRKGAKENKNKISRQDAKAAKRNNNQNQTGDAK
jgi:hypothetical protein